MGDQKGQREERDGFKVYMRKRMPDRRLTLALPRLRSGDRKHCYGGP